jgi:hypothetical protein
MENTRTFAYAAPRYSEMGRTDRPDQQPPEWQDFIAPGVIALACGCVIAAAVCKGARLRSSLVLAWLSMGIFLFLCGLVTLSFFWLFRN